MSSRKRCVNVAVEGPLRRSFTYSLPDTIDEPQPGQRLLVPFGKSQTIGFYLGRAQAPAGIAVKEVLQTLDDESYFSKDLFSLCLWMADYYFANPADCLIAALPSALKKTRTKITGQSLDVRSGRKDIMESSRLTGYRVATADHWQELLGKKFSHLERFDEQRSRVELRAAGWSDHALRKAIAAGILEPVYGEDLSGILDMIKPREQITSLTLNTEQQVAYQRVLASLGKGFSVYLLHGVTGSGKTLVYCHLASDVIKSGKSVLVLTPEISLTGATLAYFRGFFGAQVTVIHSGMTERERLQSWRGIRRGEFRIAIGPRSALFAPFENLGLIVVDEEHDGSYKQDEPSPRFHGRDSAIMRAKLAGLPILLGSASPSVESYHHARSGRYHLLELTKRPAQASLPIVRVVDMRGEGAKGEMSFVSVSLKREVGKRLQNNEQAILYLNRRGYSPQLKCSECGHVPRCPGCLVTLTFHKAGRKLSCHYCDYANTRYDRCEKCTGTKFLFAGTGTQKVEEAIPKLFEAARTIRLDSDSAVGRHSIYHILNDFAHRKYDLLLGTQMVTKGLDLPGVSLVGVLAADQGADLPDFRSSEKTFARLLQVAGRSGRADRKGEVLIQTYAPESDLIRDAARQDYQSFYEREVLSRQAGNYPPFVRLVRFVLSGPDEKQVETVSSDFRKRLEQETRKAGISVILLGPAPCPMYHLRRSYRRHLIAKTTKAVRLVQLLTSWESAQSRFGLPTKVKLVVDVDPDDMM